MNSLFSTSRMIAVEGGILFISATNIPRKQAIECTAFDWMVFWGEDPNLTRILALNDDQLQDYAEQAAQIIETDQQLSGGHIKIFCSLYRDHFSKVVPHLRELSKNYEFIRVFAR